MSDSIEKWTNRVTNSRDFRDKEKGVHGWDRFIEEYRGNYRLGPIAQNIAIIPMNLVFAYVHTEIPRLYFRDPYISINPKGDSFIQRAKVLEVAINYIFSELNVKKEIFKTLIDTILVGHGWFKFGYSGTFGKIETVIDRKSKKKDGIIEEVNEFVKSEEVFVLHVPWEDMVFDSMSNDPPYDSRWVAHRIVRPVEAIKSSELYENTAGLKSNYTSKDFKVDYDLVELWEIWDKDSGRVYVIAQGHNKFLRQADWPYQMEGFPFSMLKFNVNPGKPYPISDIALIEPQVMEKIKLRSMQLNHLKRWNRQIFIEKSAIAKEELEKYQLGQDGAVIQPEPGGVQKIFLPQYPPIQAEIFQVENLIQMDMDSIIGQTQIERGAPAQTRTRTLGEVELLRAGSLTRAERKKDALEDFLEEVSRKLVQLLKQFQLTPRYVRSLGQDVAMLQSQLGEVFDGNGLFFSRDDIQGEFDIEVKAGSTIPLSKENRLRVLQEILRLGPAIGIQPNGIVARAVGREILRDLDIKEAERAFSEEEAALKTQGALLQQQAQVLGGLGDSGIPEPSNDLVSGGVS